MKVPTKVPFRSAVSLACALLAPVAFAAGEGDSPPERFPEIIDARMGTPPRLRQTWEQIRRYDPKNHNPDDYQYLISELDGPRVNAWTIPQIRDESVAQGNFRICGSLIGTYERRKEFVGTFRGKIALIFDVPALNVGVMHREDMSSGPARRDPNLDLVARFNSGVATMMRFVDFGVYNQPLSFFSPSGLLKDTVEGGATYNEVDFVGNNLNHGTLIHTKGYLVECDIKRARRDPDLKKIFNGKNTALFPSALPRAEKRSLLENCLDHDAERTGEVLDAILDMNATLPIVLLNEQ